VAPLHRALWSWAEAHLSHPGAAAVLAEAWCEGLPIHWWRRDVDEAFVERGSPLVPVLLAILARCDPASHYPAAAARALARQRVTAAVPLVEAASRKEEGGPLIEALSGFDGSAAVAALRRLAQDRRPDRIAAAARALGQRRDRASLPRMRGWLRHPSPEVRRAAVEALGRTGDATDRARLSALTSDPDLREAATLARLRLRDPAVLARLARLVADRFAGASRGETPPLDALVPDLGPDLAPLLWSADATLARQTLDLLVAAAPRLPLAALLRLLDGSPPAARAPLAWALADRRDPGAEAALLALVRLEDPALVKAGSYGLALLGRPAGLGPLVERLRHPSPAVRAGVVVALCRWPEPGRGAGLAPLLRLADEADRGEAAEAVLACWDHERGRPALRRGMGSRAAEDRRLALRLLVGRATRGADPELARALDDPDPEVRQLAGRWLLHQAPDALERLLSPGAPRRHATVLEAAWRSGARLATAPLVAGVLGADPEVRRQALRLLGRQRGARDLPLAIARVPGDDPRWRARVLRELAALPDERAWPRLRAALGDPDEAVSRLATRHLLSHPAGLDLQTRQQLVGKVPGPALSGSGDRRLIPALWAAFDRDLLPWDQQCDWHTTIDQAADALTALGLLGARRAFTAAELRTRLDHLSCNLRERAGAFRTVLQEVSGRPLDPLP
jgi:HEAT repeat protein